MQTKLFHLSSLVWVIFLPSLFASERIVKEVVLYNYSEDITYIDNGPYAHHVAFLEDMKVVGYPAARFGNDSIKTLFDFSSVQPTFRPNGLAYIASEQRFGVVTRTFPDRLMVFDAKGRLDSTRTIQYPPGYVPNWVEGLGYIPADSAVFPDHLALCGGEQNPTTLELTADIFILRRDGALARQIHLPLPYSECGAVAFQAPDRLLISAIDGDWNIVTPMDFDGNILGPTSPVLQGGIEGVVTLPGGEILAIGGNGRVYSLDGNLQRNPGRDRHYRPDMGTGGVTGLTWDSGRDLFVLNGRPNDGAAFYTMFDLAPTFSGATRLADLYSLSGDPHFGLGQMTFLPVENLIAMRQARQRDPSRPKYVPASILLFSNANGSYVGLIDLEPLGLGNPRALAYLPNKQQFAVSFGSEAGRVHILDRHGAHVRAIDYTATITGPVNSVAFFDPSHPSGGRLMLSDGTKVYVGDLDGNATEQFPATVFPGMVTISGLATITSGPYTGTFAAVVNSQWASIQKLVLFALQKR